MRRLANVEEFKESIRSAGYITLGVDSIIKRVYASNHELEESELLDEFIKARDSYIEGRLTKLKKVNEKDFNSYYSFRDACRKYAEENPLEIFEELI